MVNGCEGYRYRLAARSARGAFLMAGRTRSRWLCRCPSLIVGAKSLARTQPSRAALLGLFLTRDAAGAPMRVLPPLSLVLRRRRTAGYQRFWRSHGPLIDDFAAAGVDNAVT